MPSYFYLSHARRDNNELLEEFFEDLSFTVRTWLRLSQAEEVGFFDPKPTPHAQGWRPEASEALRTSQTMIALVSPNYFRSDDAGKEWQIFETRRRSIEKSGVNRSPIIPVIWIPCKDPTPRLLDRAQYDWGEPFKIYRLNGLMKLMEFRDKLASWGDEYWEVLMALGKQISELVRTVMLPALDSTPPFKKVQSAFQAPPLGLDFTSGSKNTKRPKAAIIENNQQVRDMLAQHLGTLGYDCHLYWKADDALNAILNGKNQSEPFDVVLVDLELDPKEMQGLKLIERLAADDSSPPMIAMSAGLSNSEFIQALKAGADDVVSKPFDLLSLENRIGNVALIGQGRRQFRERPGSKIQDRVRPVFLSYSNIDKRTAKILKTQIEARGIGVWYAPDSLGAEDPTLEGISDGLKKAEIFVPLVTDNFARSPWCVFEMATCEQGSKKAVIPVLEGCLHRMRNFDLVRLITEKFVCDITFDRFADGFTLLLGHIQQAIAKNKNTHVGSNRSL